ncbi:MAG: RluA family pseudouridine synthase [Chloroflexi bacterium]|nr:RluA family pseudouridine synthase [Chloroflexota bacterium]
METQTLTVTESNSRLDRYVSDHLPELSRAAVQRLIDDGQILVDGVARKPSYKVQIGETITVRVPPPEPAIPQAEKIPLDILYEDDDLIVINKPAGMVVHPAAGHSAGTLVNAILAHCPHLNVGGVERPGIVHRLDSETSGIIVVAKNDATMRDLQAQFKSRRVHKTYLALVDGIVKPPRGKIDAPIGRDPKHRQKMAVVTQGKTRASVTIYRTLATLERPSTAPLSSTLLRSARDVSRYTLLEAQPQTGRTHQIRVHLAFLGFPVVADSIYGRTQNALGLTRQFLHAWKISFTLPRDGREVNFVAPLPKELVVALEKLGFDQRSLQ